MSVRSEKAAVAPTNVLAALDVNDTSSPASSDSLAEGNNYCVANPENPLKRNVVVSIKATLNDFCLQKSRGTWAPTQEALRNICKSTIQHHFVHSHRHHTLAHTLRLATHSPAEEVHLTRWRGRSHG